VRHLGPAEDLKASLEILDEGGAALDPIPIVAIRYPVNETDFGGMDVATDHTVGTPPSRLRHHRFFVIANVFDSIFYFVFQVCGKRPIRKSELPSHNIKPNVHGKHKIVRRITNERQPLGIFYDSVELIAMNDQKIPAIRRIMKGLLQHDHATETVRGEIPKIFIMVSGNVNYPRSFSGFSKYFLHHIVMTLSPVP
jgi:hypothetical protein